MRLVLPAICIVTRARGPAASPDRARLLERLAAASRAGATMIQVRERQLSDRELLEFVVDLRRAVGRGGALVLVNDRTDIALASGADGVHLKSDGAAGIDVRRIVPENFVVGRSLHSLDEAAAPAFAGGCDYLLFGTVFPSRSKPQDHPVAGLESLRQVCRAVQLPVLAIGGMDVSRASEVASAGASGIAAISLFAEARDIESTVAALRRALTPSGGRV